MAENLPLIKPSEHARMLTIVGAVCALLGSLAAYPVGVLAGTAAAESAMVEASLLDPKPQPTFRPVACYHSPEETARMCQGVNGSAVAVADAARCEVAAIRELYGRCLAGDCVSRLPETFCAQ